jgi:hypothetical protein
VFDTIQLSDQLIIGKGRDRICYKHPTIDEICIKISIKGDKQSKREVRYFTFLKNRNSDLSKISIYRGKENTNLGIGFSFELIRDHNGNVSKTLRQALESRDISIQEVQPKLLELKTYLIANRICVRDISPSNISCQITTQGLNLVIIDGVSNANLNPLTIRLQSLVNKAIDKAWKGLDRKLIRIEKSLLP